MKLGRVFPKWIRQNLGWKLLSLLIAAILWISVAGEPELSTFATVPVVFLDMPGDLEISSRRVENVSLELRGPAGDLRDFYEGSRGAVVLDMSEVRAGEHTFTIGEDNVRLPRNIRLVRAVPSQLRFELQRVVSRRVPIQARFSNSPPPGYVVAKAEVIPPTASVAGPEAAVMGTNTVFTDPIDLSAVVGSAEFRANVFSGDTHVRLLTTPNVTVKVTIKKDVKNPA